MGINSASSSSPLPKHSQTLHGTASPDCRETARGGARGVNVGIYIWQYNSNSFLLLPVRHLLLEAMHLLLLAIIVTTNMAVPWSVCQREVNNALSLPDARVSRPGPKSRDVHISGNRIPRYVDLDLDLALPLIPR